MTVRGISSIRKLSTTQHDERELIPNFRSRVRELENEVQSWTISPTVPRSDDDRIRLLSYSKHKHFLESTWPCVFVCFAQMHTILHTSSTFIHCFHANEMKWMWNPDSHLFTKQFDFAVCMCVCGCMQYNLQAQEWRTRMLRCYNDVSAVSGTVIDATIVCYFCDPNASRHKHQQ